MIIQPNAHNSIEVILNDGTVLDMHDTVHSGKSYLFVKCKEGLQVDKAKELDWESVAQTKSFIRLSSKAEGKEV